MTRISLLNQIVKVTVCNSSKLKLYTHCYNSNEYKKDDDKTFQSAFNRGLNDICIHEKQMERERKKKEKNDTRYMCACNKKLSIKGQLIYDCFVEIHIPSR